MSLNPLKVVKRTTKDLVAMMMGGGSDQPIIPRMGGNVGPTQKQVYSGMRQGVASLSGADAIKNFHDKPGLLSAAGLMMAVPMSPGQQATMATKLNELRKTGGFFQHALGDTGTVLRTVDTEKYPMGMPFLSHSGKDKGVRGMLRSFQADDGEKLHLLHLLTKKGANKAESKLLPEDLAGSFSTSTSPEWGHAILQEGHIRPEFRGKGIYGEGLRVRDAQATAHLGYRPPMGGTFSNDAMPAIHSAVKKGIIKPDFMTLDQIIHHTADRLPRNPRGLAAKAHLHSLSEDLALSEPRWEQGARTTHVPAERLKHILDTIDRYKGLH